MPALLPVFLTASQILTASPLVLVASKPPSFNVEPTCRSALEATNMPGRDIQACLKDEEAAHTKLNETWNSFSAKVQSDCLRLSLLDGQPSYVEVLTCLEIAAEAKKEESTTGFGSPR